jgi:hypothetical protein
VRQGERVDIPFDDVSDWMIMMDTTTLGGFTVQFMRAQMDTAERAEHDQAWGRDFGDPAIVHLAYQADEHPEYLVEHPMCVNLAERYREEMGQHLAELEEPNEQGLTELLNQAMTGNGLFVKALVEAGANTAAQTPSGKTALDLARQMNWPHVIGHLA